MKLNAKKIMLPLLLMMVGLLFLIGGVSYSFFTTKNNGNKQSSIIADGITFKYTEGSNTLNSNEAMPMSDGEGMAQTNYFEFDIEGKAPKDVKIPYYITAMKENGSSNIDDAIKLGITKVYYNNYDIYSSYFEYNSPMTLQECQTMLIQVANNSNYKLECIKMYSAGDTIPNTSTVLESDMYIVAGEILSSKEECEKNSNNCILKYSKGTYELGEDFIKIVKYSSLNQYINSKIDLSNHTEKEIYQGKIKESSNKYKVTYRIRMWIDYDTDFTQSKYNNANFSLRVNVYSEGQISEKLEPGLYDSNNNLIASWDTLVNTYGLDVENDYEYGNDYDIDDDTSTYTYNNSNMYGYIVANNPNLAAGTKIILGNVSMIGDSAFEGCSNLEEVIVPSTVTSIGFGAFESCTNLENIEFKVNSEITVIDSYAFENCSNLTFVEIPSSVSEIGSSAFKSCTNLSVVTLEPSSSLTTIGKDAFSDTIWYNVQAKKNCNSNINSCNMADVYLNGIQLQRTSVFPGGPVVHS